MVPALLALVLAAPDAEAAPPPRELTPAVLLDRMANEYARINKDFYRELRAAKTDAANSEANRKNRDAWRTWSEAAIDLVRKYPTEPAAFDVIAVLTDRSAVYTKELVPILRAHHFANPAALKLVNSLSQERDPLAREFVDEVAGKHPDRTVRGRTLLALGRMDRIYLVDSAKPRPSFGGRLGPPDKLRVRAAEYLTRVVKDYADIPAEGETLGKLAEAELAGLKNVGNLEVGKPAPEIVGEDVDGKPLKLTPADGKVKVLVFWGSWCGPCMRMVPREKALAEKYHDRPFALVGVNGGDKRPQARKAMAEKGMTWPSFYSGDRGGIAAEWNVDAWPSVYVIDHAGIIRYKSYDEGDLEKVVEECLAKLDPAGK